MILKNLNLLKSFGYSYIENLHFNDDKIISNITLNSINEMIDNCNLCTLSNLCDKKILYNNHKNKNIIFVSTVKMYQTEIHKFFIDCVSNTLNINENEINLTNILKCDIKITSNKIKDELSICSKYLKNQIDILNPDLVVYIGNSYEYMIKNHTDISKGNIISYNGNNIIVLDDPYFVLQNPSKKEDFLRQIEKIKRIWS